MVSQIGFDRLLSVDCAPMEQLDLFAHSRDVMLRRDVLAAIEARRALPGRVALDKLTSAYPQDSLLPAFEVLVCALESPVVRFSDHEAALTAGEILETVIQSAANRLLSPTSARHWIEQEWRAQAQAAEDLAYSPISPQAHAVPCLLRAGAWRAAECAVGRIASWRRIPLPLAWMTQARMGSDGLAASWPLLAELAWLDPPGFDGLVRGLEDASLQRLLRDFDANYDANFEDESASGADDPAQELAWFPAWCLLAEPGLAHPFRQTEPGTDGDPERAARLLLELLLLEKQGSPLLLQRKQLRGLHAGLFARYMQTR